MLDYAALAAELAGPDLSELTDAEAVLKLNTDTSEEVTRLVPGRYLAEGGILRVLGPSDGDAALSAIEAAANLPEDQNPLAGLLTRIVRILRDQAGEGIDFGDAVTHGMLDTLQGQGVLSPDVVAALKAYGAESVTPTRAEAVFGRAVTLPDVIQARGL